MERVEPIEVSTEYRIVLPGGLVLKSATITRIVCVGPKPDISHYIAAHHTVNADGEPADNVVRVPLDAEFTRLSEEATP